MRPKARPGAPRWDELRAYLMLYLGRSLEGVDIGTQTVDRLKEFWSWRLEEARVEPRRSEQELVNLGWWFGSEAFDDEWLTQQLSFVVSHFGKIEPSFRVLPRLAKISVTGPRLV